MEIDGGKCQVGGRTDGRTRRTALPRKKQAALIVIESYGRRPLSQSVSQSGNAVHDERGGGGGVFQGKERVKGRERSGGKATKKLRFRCFLPVGGGGRGL